MPNVRLYQSLEVAINGVEYKIGSRNAPQEIAIDGLFVDKRFTLATATTKKIFDTDDDEITNFDVLAIVADKDIFIEIQIDEDGDNGQEEIAIKQLANVPFILSTDDGKANYTEAFAAGTDDLIEIIQVRNESGSTANIRFLAFT